MMQLGSLDDDDEPKDLDDKDGTLMDWEISPASRCQALGGQCDTEGKFLPIQCEEETCWCVDEAGNQLPNTNTFLRGEHLCCKDLKQIGIILLVHSVEINRYIILIM